MLRAIALCAQIGAAALPAAAADLANVAAVEPFLRNDEKAFLASVLIDADASDEFDQDAKAAAGDPKLMKLVLDKWRGRMAVLAQGESTHPNPDLDGHYRTYADMMTPVMRAYLLRRLPTMVDKDRNSLIGYLNEVNESLASNNGTLTWYMKKVVSAIFDHYRTDFATYLPTPLAQQGLADGPAAAQTLAAGRQQLAQAAAQAAAAKAAAAKKAEQDKQALLPKLPPSAIGAKPGASAGAPGVAPVAGTPAGGASGGSAGPIQGADPAKDALEQAKNAADAGKSADASEKLGRSFDGGAGSGTPPAVAGNDGAGTATLPPATGGGGGGTPNLTGSVPAPPGDDFLKQVDKLKTGGGGIAWRKIIPIGGGALAGAALGFAVAGPIGALVGGLLGLFAGFKIRDKLFA